MPRTPPARTPEQQKEHERRTALLTLDIPATRAWMDRYGFGAQGSDQAVLISMHETRITDPAMPARARSDSRRWLKVNYPQSSVLKRAA